MCGVFDAVFFSALPNMNFSRNRIKHGRNRARGCLPNVPVSCARYSHLLSATVAFLLFQTPTSQAHIRLQGHFCQYLLELLSLPCRFGWQRLADSNGAPTLVVDAPIQSHRLRIYARGATQHHHRPSFEPLPVRFSQILLSSHGLEFSGTCFHLSPAVFQGSFFLSSISTDSSYLTAGLCRFFFVFFNEDSVIFLLAKLVFVARQIRFEFKRSVSNSQCSCFVLVECRILGGFN